MKMQMNFYSRNKQLKSDINSAIKIHVGKSTKVNMSHMGYNLTNLVEVSISPKKQKYSEDYMNNIEAKFGNGEILNTIELEKMFGYDFLLALITLTISNLDEEIRVKEQNELLTEIRETIGCQ